MNPSIQTLVLFNVVSIIIILLYVFAQIEQLKPIKGTNKIRHIIYAILTGGLLLFMLLSTDLMYIIHIN